MGKKRLKLLHLTLKKKWFDMILSGEKTEEYRDIKPYWKSRLEGRDFAHHRVVFRNGYGAHAPLILVELKEITTGIGKLEWGAPETTPVYILKLGEILWQPKD